MAAISAAACTGSRLRPPWHTAPLGGLVALAEAQHFGRAAAPGSPLAACMRISMAQLSRERILLLEDGHCPRAQAMAASGESGAGAR